MERNGIIQNIFGMNEAIDPLKHLASAWPRSRYLIM